MQTPPPARPARLDRPTRLLFAPAALALGVRWCDWEKLSAGGDDNAQQCGWLKDRYGVSWQIVPIALIDMVGDAESAKSQRAMKAMLQMKKIDIAELKRAYDG